MKVKQCMKITETRVRLTDAESNLIAECPEKYAQVVQDALNKYATLQASHAKLVEANEIYSHCLIDTGERLLKSKCPHALAAIMWIEQAKDEVRQALAEAEKL